MGLIFYADVSLELRFTDFYAFRWNVVEAVDVEGSRLVCGNDYVRIVEGPFEPMAEEMPFDPAETV